MFYVTHDMAEVERLADALVLMESGRVRAAGRLNQLQSDPTAPLAGGQKRVGDVRYPHQQL